MNATAKHPGDCAADHGLPCRVCEVSRRPEYRRALVTLAAPTDCIHRGAATGARVPCVEGCKGVREIVFACAIHGTCTVGKRGEGVAGRCKGCTERTVIAVPELLPGLPDPLPVPELPAPLPDGWAHDPAVQERHAAALRRLAAAPLPSPVAAGDGIVICGGGRYWPMICIAVRMAREVTDLPIQIWHRGAGEAVDAADLADVAGVSIVDACGHDCRILRGWETKSLALLHCGWERVLYMDADAYLVADPRPWLDTATPDAPFVFWQDLPKQNGRIRWSGWGMADPDIPPVQGGQLAIHRAAAWRTLVLFHFANQHSDYYYQHGFGDQDCWPPVLAAGKGRYRCLGMSPWQWPAYVLPWGGAPLIVHRCRGKLWATPQDKYEAALPGEERVWHHRQQLLAARQPVPSAADWRARRLRALHREERCDAPGGPGPGNRIAGLLDLIAAASAGSAGDTSHRGPADVSPRSSATAYLSPAAVADAGPGDTLRSKGAATSEAAAPRDTSQPGAGDTSRSKSAATTEVAAPGDTTALRVLEIGSYRGVSSEAFALTCAAVTCVDPWDDEAVYQAFRARMAGYPHVRVVRGRSPEALTAMPAAAFDLVYIDAIHAAAELAADARAAWRVVRPGGWIAGHDFGGPLAEVTETVRRLFGEPRVFADSSWLVRRPEDMP